MENIHARTQPVNKTLTKNLQNGNNDCTIQNWAPVFFFKSHSGTKNETSSTKNK